MVVALVAFWTISTVFLMCFYANLPSDVFIKGVIAEFQIIFIFGMPLRLCKGKSYLLFKTSDNRPIARLLINFTCKKPKKSEMQD